MAYENIQRGEYQVGSELIYFRSKWEANYALYLEWLKEKRKIADWQYEPQPYYEFPIKHGTTRYLPDFKVTNKDGTFYLVELKGFRQGMVKIKRMRKYFPKIKIELIDKDGYNQLKRKLGKALRFY